MTWTEPRNLRDNTVITANYWNSVIGSRGSVAYLQRKTNQRANCTVFSAPFTATIAVTDSSTIGTTRISAFSTVASNRNVTDRRFFNKNTGAIILPDNTPVLILWSIKVLNANSNYTVRSTLELQRRTSERRVTTTVASEYLFRSNVDSNILTGAYATVSWYKKDRYFLTCNHNHVADLDISGTITIIVNPSFV